MHHAQKRGWGVSPDFSITNTRTGKILFGEIKRQDGWVEGKDPSAGRGNAHERMCKLFTPGLLNAYREIGASLSMVLYAHSMPPEEIVQLLGAESTKKDIIFTVAREEYVKPMLTRAKARFRISKASKGIAFACPIDAVSGIAVYKFLSDQNKNVRINENGKQK